MTARGLRPDRRWAWAIGAIALTLILGSTTAPTSAATATLESTHRATTQSEAVAHGTSPALGSMRPAAPVSGLRQVPSHATPPEKTGTQPVAPGALQGPSRTRSLATAPSANRNFAGLGQGFVGPQGTFSVQGMPPDPNGDVGPNNYVQIVNYSVAVFDRAGTVLYGPVPTNTLWTGFGGLCELHNDGDPMVVYDGLADRWVISQFAFQSGGPDYECVAVSTTADPLGTYALYAYSYEQMNDYPKLAVWPDGYYLTYDMYDATTDDPIGVKACALDRSKMLANLPANQQCVDFYGLSFLPSDVDGPTPPPAGSPNYILGGSYTAWNQLDMYRFHVDWANPAHSDLAGPFAIPVAPFSNACSSIGRKACIPQARTDQLLESLSGRMMHRLAYRNYGTHESLASNMTVAATADPNGQTASRWYEIRSPGAASPTVYQQGTYAPDASYRWMASIAMDANQNMAMGYSKSSADTSPTIAYTGRLATDPLGIMQTETAVELPSMGSQTSPVRYAGRWGDYTAMQVDPADDCTFWYINQYLPSDGLFNWRTRIVSFKFPSCKSEPGSPTSVAGTAGIASATVSWTRPVQVGTSPISGYTVTSEPSVATPTSCRNVAATSCVFTGLTPGVPYTFRVTATNAVGTGAASDPSPPVTPLPPPPLRRQVPVGGCVIVPRLIPRAGLRQLERPRCLTNAGQPVRVTVTGRLRGDLRYWKVIRKANGAVFIRTYGYHLRLIITWSAPAVGDFTAYRLGRSYRT